MLTIWCVCVDIFRANNKIYIKYTYKHRTNRTEKMIKNKKKKCLSHFSFSMALKLNRIHVRKEKSTGERPPTKKDEEKKKRMQPATKIHKWDDCKQCRAQLEIYPWTAENQSMFEQYIREILLLSHRESEWKSEKAMSSKKCIERTNERMNERKAHRNHSRGYIIN